MKNYLLAIFCLSLSYGVFGQSLSLLHEGVALDPGATLQVIGDPSAEIIECYLSVINHNANETKVVKVKKIVSEGDTLAGTTNAFCWGACYADTTYVGFASVFIQPLDTASEFIGDYRPNQVPGISKVRYVFFDDIDRNDTVTITIEYKTSAASVGDDLAENSNISGVYPNPVSDIAYIDYSIPGSVKDASIVITNLLGARVKEVRLESRSGKTGIHVSEMVSGIYFYSLIADSQVVVTRKFVVK
jgi:hypothetical protein